MMGKAHPCLVLNGESTRSFEKMEHIRGILAFLDLRFFHESLLKIAPTRAPLGESIERFALLSESSLLHHEGLPPDIASQLKL